MKRQWLSAYFSSSRTIAYYTNNHEINELINHNIMKDLYKNYHHYLKVKNLQIKRIEYFIR